MKLAFEKLYFFYVICTLSGTTNRVFAGSASVASGGGSDSALLALNIIVVCATLLIAYPKLPSILAMLTKLKFLFALYFLAVVSVVWSVDRVSTFRALAYSMAYLLSAAYIAVRYDSEEILDQIGKSIVILAVLSIPGQFLLPDNGFSQGGWQGVFMHKDGLGLGMVIGITALTASRRPWTLLRLGSVALCVVMLLLSGAVGSYLWALAGIATLAFLRSRGHGRPVFLVAILSPLIILPIALTNTTEVLTGMVGKDSTFTGRTGVWAAVMKMIINHPLLGYGFGAFWPTEIESVHRMVGNWSPGHAHNGYLDICLNLGIVGLLAVLLVLADAILRARRARSESEEGGRIWLLMIIASLVVLTMSEVAFLQNNLMWFGFLIAYLSYWRTEYLAGVEYANDDFVDGRQLSADS